MWICHTCSSPAGDATIVVFRHPSSWQASVINPREPWDGVQGITWPGWSLQKMSPYGTKALTPNTPFRLRAPYEDSEGAKLLHGQAHLWISSDQKGISFPGEVYSQSVDIVQLPSRKRYHLWRTGLATEGCFSSSNCLFSISFKYNFLNAAVSPLAVSDKNAEDQQAKTHLLMVTAWHLLRLSFVLHPNLVPVWEPACPWQQERLGFPSGSAEGHATRGAGGSMKVIDRLCIRCLKNWS